MTITEVIDEFRRQVQDLETPYLFSDDEILLWLIDAQDMLVRGFGGFADFFTPELTQVSVTANEPWSDISPYILRIRSGQMQTARTPVDFIHEGDLESLQMKDYGFSIPIDFLDDADTGAVRAGILELTDGKIRWYKVPESDDVCKLHIYRLPYPRITDTDCKLEVQEQHHLHLIKWMKYMAYSKEDAETYDKALADTNETAFNSYVEKVKQEMSRLRHKPKQVRYGGIPW